MYSRNENSLPQEVNPNREEERRLWIFDFGISMGRRPRNPSKIQKGRKNDDFGFLTWIFGRGPSHRDSMKILTY
jgi:hypothetical protein